MWDPAQYGRFDEARARPFLDLLARVQLSAARQVVDLGCGTGALTALLAKRWPEARVIGIDSSPEMLEAARSRSLPERLELRLGDLRDFSVEDPTDLVVANASLQWVPEHRELVATLAASLPTGGVLAFQVPGNFGAPSHQGVVALCRSARWRDRLGEVARPQVQEPAEYLEALAGGGLEVDAWETTYLHVLAGDRAVVEWLKGTALRPVLARLPVEDQASFLDELAERLAPEYPARSFGTLFPFRRIFVVARHG